MWTGKLTLLVTPRTDPVQGESPWARGFQRGRLIKGDDGLCFLDHYARDEGGGVKVLARDVA